MNKRVRIAVAMSPTGEYTCVGFEYKYSGKPPTDKQLAGQALEFLAMDLEKSRENSNDYLLDTVYFVEADVPVPSLEDKPTIDGEVSEPYTS